MKKIFTQSLVAVMFTAYACYADDRGASNPGISLNPQDVPVFYENNPLSGMKSFTVITSLPLKDTGMQTRIENAIEKTLETAGQVTHLKDNDMRGFGAGNVLLVQIDKATGWDGTETSISRLSLSIETTVTLEKTCTKTFPMIWSINTFVQEPIDSNSEGNLTKAIQKLVGDFVQNYKYANQGQAKRPVFYTYN
jgi:hypothetical protein